LSGSLAGKLAQHFGEDSVFLDRHQIEPGDRWRDEIDGALSKAVVVLAVIGPHWLTTHDEFGQRRIDRDDDVLAYELSVVLARKIAIVPLYLHGL
jgi:diphthamide biosynthesis methyltransferase